MYSILHYKRIVYFCDSFYVFVDGIVKNKSVENVRSTFTGLSLELLLPLLVWGMEQGLA